MRNYLKTKLKNEKGLTLVEVLAVVVILAIIAAIAIPSVGNIVKNSEAKAQIADALGYVDAANLYFLDNPGAVAVAGIGASPSLVADGYVDSPGKITAVTVSKASPTKPVTISFTTSGGTAYPDATVAQLTGATVKKGVITLGK